MRLNVFASIENESDGEFHGTQSRQIDLQEADLPVTISLPTVGGIIHVHLEPAGWYDGTVKRETMT